MNLQVLDTTLIAVYFTISFSIAILLSKRSGKNTEEFFLSGRKLSWWIAGTTMVATTFAADTPLAVTELVAKNGIAGNWLWWNFVAGNMLTVFFFARLWRRANILTDVEFIEMRYSGKPAAFLRGFKAIYLGIFLNVIIMAWVNLALKDILGVIFNVPESKIFLFIVGAMIIVGVYSALSGLRGIAYTDIFQFVIAMTGCIILAVVVLEQPQVGGIDGLLQKLPDHMFSFFPKVGLTIENAAQGVMALTFSAFIAYIGIQWWSSWYPGAEPGGGGYIAQRMMSAKNERHSLLATLWFTIAHYAIRPWPWIIVALCSVILFPGLTNPREGFILAMKNYLPTGLLGLLIAAFLAAYMSTISTHLNWGSSYIINDLYKRFMHKEADEKHFVAVSRITAFILVILSALLTTVITSISGAWEFLINCGAGLGLVLILRWYWWRVNAWSEITAMIVPVIAYSINFIWLEIPSPQSLFFIVPVTTVAWLLVTILTKPTEEPILQKFYETIKPPGPGWNSFRRKYSLPKPDESLRSTAINWFIGTTLAYVILFGIGKIIFKEYILGFLLLGGSIVLFLILNRRLKNIQ